MKGSFQMKDRHSHVFDAEIAEFDLKSEWMIN